VIDRASVHGQRRFDRWFDLHWFDLHCFDRHFFDRH